MCPLGFIGSANPTDCTDFFQSTKFQMHGFIIMYGYTATYAVR